MTVAQPWLELWQFFKGAWHVVMTLPASEDKCPMNYSPIAVLAVQFHNRSPSVTEDIEICQSYITTLSSRHQYLCFSPMESSLKAIIISCLRPPSGFKLEIQCPLAKMCWKNVSHNGWPTKKMLVSWIVICTSKSS